MGRGHYKLQTGLADRVGRLNSLPKARELVRYPRIRDTYASASMEQGCSTVKEIVIK